MQWTKYLFILLFSIFTLALSGQNHILFYNAFINSKMQDWKKEIDRMENTPNKSDDFKLELVNYQIGYIGYCVTFEKFDEASQYMELSESYLEELEMKNFKPSYVQSYIGAIDGLKIGMNSFYALILGAGIVSKAKSSIELDDKNYNGYILIGNSKYYMWAMLGGSKDDALDYYKKAEEIMENEKIASQNWSYLSLLTMIAHAYVEMGKYSYANNYYKKILQVEPNYKWVKEEIYPQFLKDYENK